MGVICDTGRCFRFRDSALRLEFSCVLQSTPCCDDDEDDDDVEDDDDDGKARSKWTLIVPDIETLPRAAGGGVDAPMQALLTCSCCCLLLFLHHMFPC